MALNNTTGPITRYQHNWIYNCVPILRPYLEEMSEKKIKIQMKEMLTFRRKNKFEYLRKTIKRLKSSKQYILYFTCKQLIVNKIE